MSSSSSKKQRLVNEEDNELQQNNIFLINYCKNLEEILKLTRERLKIATNIIINQIEPVCCMCQNKYESICVLQCGCFFLL